MDLEQLTAATFEPHVGTTFTIEVAAERVPLVLESVATLADRPGGRDPFSLLFRGSAEPLLAQSIRRLEHAELGVLEIFIVPLAPDRGGARYEAIFS